MRTVIITTSVGRDELTRRGASTLGSVEIHALDSNSGSIAPQAILQLLQSQFGVKTLLHEGGPTLFGQFLAAEAIDELFLTLSPQIAGRTGDQLDRQSCKEWSLGRSLRLGFRWSAPSKGLRTCTCATGCGGAESLPALSFSAAA